jgi:uncharacterized membrane protein YbhN (UPF0104 family)
MSSELHPRIIQRLRGLSWRRLLTGVFSVILFGYLFVTLAANWQALLQYEWRVNPLYLAASMGAYIVSLLLGAFTWHLTVWSMDQKVPYRKNTKFYLRSNVAKRLPGLVWYALSRLYLYEREGVAKSVITVALTLELISLIAGGLLAYVTTLWSNATAIAAIQQWWLILPLAGLAAVVIRPQSLYAVVNWILAKRGHPAIHEQASRGDLVKLILLQGGGWLTGGLFIYFLTVGIYPDLGWSQLIGVVNSWTGAGLVGYITLLVPLGLGLKEVTLAYLLSAFVPWPVAVLISLLGRICSIIGDCVGLLLASRL